MFRGAAQRQFDLLLFWSLDRFTREGVLETLTYLNRLTAAGVGYRSLPLSPNRNESESANG
jgi:DNA invertase Pin-like site-specific DNA recombinase